LAVTPKRRATTTTRNDRSRRDGGIGIRAVGTRSAVDQVAEEIRRAIVEGDLAPGEQFTMTELSAQLQVSHIPLREALRRFEAQGLVTLRPGRSAAVAPLDARQVEDVARLWILVANDVTARACAHYTDDDFARFEATLDELTRLPQQSDEAHERHRDFHLQLVLPGASEWDLRILDMLWTVMDRAVRLSHRAALTEEPPKGQARRSYEEHRRILDAARARDAATLTAELRAHHESHMALVVAGLP
jgi:DNA-binding GntR family transcriptional regulator